MPDTDPGTAADPPEGGAETRNLPVPVTRPASGGSEAEKWFARLLRAFFGWNSVSVRSALKNVLEAHAGGLSPKERAMLRNILGLRERRVVDVMIPRADIIAVPQDIALGELLKVFANQGHSRLVVYGDTLDDAIGMVHIRDLIAAMTARAEEAAAKPGSKRKKPLPAGLDLRAVELSMPLSVTKLVREMLFVPPSMPVLDLLAKMQATRIHLALVVDEYGGTDGAASMEDIVEEIVGEIADEHDEHLAPSVIRQADGSFLADGRASLEDVTSTIGPQFDAGEIAKDVDTLAGYLASRIGRVPVRGEVVPGPGQFEIEVLEADPRRVKKLKISHSTDRINGGAHRKPRLIGTATTAQAPNEVPIPAENSPKLSPDAPPKAARQP